MAHMSNFDMTIRFTSIEAWAAFVAWVRNDPITPAQAKAMAVRLGAAATKLEQAETDASKTSNPQPE